MRRGIICGRVRQTSRKQLVEDVVLFRHVRLNLVVNDVVLHIQTFCGSIFEMLLMLNDVLLLMLNVSII